MNTYVLQQQAQAGTRIVGTAQATTQAQAARKLYRLHNVPALTASAQGYSVKFQPTPKGPAQ